MILMDLNWRWGEASKKGELHCNTAFEARFSLLATAKNERRILP